MKIRNAAIEDIDQLLPLIGQNASAAKICPDSMRHESVIYMLVRAIQDPSVVLIVCEAKDRIVGMVSVIGLPCSFDLRQMEGHESLFWVDPEFRKQGVGSSLIQAAERWCQERGMARLYFQALLDDSDYERLDAMLRKSAHTPLETRYVKELQWESA